MSLDKAIEHGKEYRKPYPKGRGKGIDTACRNHGICSWCRENRLHKYKKELARLDFEYKDWLYDWNLWFDMNDIYEDLYE